MQSEEEHISLTTASLDKNMDYISALVEFMSFFDGQPYNKDKIFSFSRLYQIKPIDIVHWMTLKVYGTTNPQEDSRPIYGRSSSLEHYKKSISYYMPEKLQPWSIRLNSGNPTRSTVVNNFIKKIKRLEVKKVGKKSSARRPLVQDEVLQTLNILKKVGKANNDLKRYLIIPAAIKFQISMIGRVDDTCRMEKEELKPHPRFDFALTAQINWSKNVMEERESPDQILLASLDWQTCLFLSLATYLEACYENGIGIHHKYLFGVNNSARSNVTFYSKALTACWKSEDFVKRQSGLIGTHSLRKYATTRARECGGSKDEVDGRGRWRKKRISDVYTAMLLPFPDARVCALLCVKGPIMYTVKENSGISKQWLKDNVVPNIIRSDVFDEDVIQYQLQVL
jgi:hypothetical protein